MIAAVASAIDDDDFEKVPAIIDKMGSFMGEVSKPFTAIVKEIKPLFETAKQMSATEASGVQALAGLFQAIGPIAQAMQIPPGMTDVLKAATESTFGENAGEILKSMGTYMDSVGAAMKSYVMPAIEDSVVGMIEALDGAKIEPAQAEVLKAVGPLISTLVNFATSMAKPAMEAKNAEDALKKSDVVARVLRSMSTELPKIFNAISGSIGTLINGVINVLKTVKIDASTKGKIEYLQLVFSVIDSLTKVAALVRDPHEWEDNLSASDGLVKGIARVAIFLDRLVGPGKAAFGSGSKAPLEAVVENAGKVTAAVGNVATLIKGTNDLKALLEAVSGMVEVVEKMTKVEMLKQDLKPLKAQITKTISNLAAIFGEFGGAQGQALVQSINSASTMMKQASSASTLVLSVAFTSMGGVVDSYNAWATKIKPIAEGGVANQVAGMKSIIDAVIKINDIVSGVQNIDITTVLQKFKANFGTAMGQKGSHVVQAKDVTINVNFTVMIDATKLEGAILSSSNSKIKEKVNLVMSATSELANSPTNEKDSKALTANTPLGKIVKTPREAVL